MAWLGVAACGGDEPVAATPRVDLAAIAAAELPPAVVQHCFAGLAGLDRCAATITGADGRRHEVQAQLPAAIRVQGDAIVVLVGDDAWTADGGAVAAERVRELQAWRELLEVATLAPLRRCRECRRIDERTFVLVQPDGRQVELTLHPRSLRPESLQLEQRHYAVREFVTTATTRVPTVIEAPGLGRCTVQLSLHDAAWPEAWFQRSGGGVPVEVGPAVVRPIEESPSFTRSRTPKIETVRALRWIVVDDPGTWPERAARYREHAAAVVAAGQSIAGFPAFFHDGGRARMAIGFRAPDGVAAYPVPAGLETRELPAGRALVVFPGEADFDGCVQAGIATLQQALAQRQLVAAGPFVAQPYFHLQKEVPDAVKLQRPQVRVSVLLQ